MDLKSAMDTVKAGIPNPVASLTGSLTSSISGLLSSAVPEIQAYALSLQSAMNAASQAAADVVSSLPIKLPLMKAADSIMGKLNIMQGISPPTGPSSNFTAAFGAVTAAKDHLTSLQNSLSPSVLSDLQAGITTNLSSLTNGVDAANSAVSGSVSSATSAINDHVGNLKAFAFAKFCSMPQPPHVQSIIDQATPLAVNKELAAAQSTTSAAIIDKTVVSSPALPSNLPKATIFDTGPGALDPDQSFSKIRGNLSAIGYTSANSYIEFHDAYFDFVEPLSKEVGSLKPQVDEAIQASNQWRDTNIPNYAAVKQTALDNPNDPAAQAAYEANKTAYSNSTTYINARSLLDTFNVKRDRVVALKKQYANWVSTYFDGVTAGPW